MGVLDLDKIPKPARVNLSYGKVVAYPHRKNDEDESQVIHAFDPKRTGYVWIQSYANCPSKEVAKEVFLTHMDLLMIIKAYETDEKFRDSINDGYKRNAIDELKRLKSTGASLTTLQNAGKDYGLSEIDIINIYRGDFVVI